MQRSSVFSGFALASLAALLAPGCGGGGYGSSYGGGGGGGGGNVVSITISPTSVPLMVGGTQQITAVSKDANGNTVTGAQLNWFSSNTAVASVSNTGLVTANAVGSANVTASITYNNGGAYSMPVTYTSNTSAITVTATDKVMGTVAVGHALAGALVTLEDARGMSVTAQSAADGRYQVSVAGLTAPFLLEADDGRGHVLFSAAAGAGVANIDPMSDVVLRAVYGARGSDPAAAFADHAVPDVRALALVDRDLTGVMRDTLQAQGLQADKFSLLATPFNADGTGFDHVLDNTAVDAAKGLSFMDGLSHRETSIGFGGGALTLTTRDLAMPAVASVERVTLP